MNARSTPPAGRRRATGLFLLLASAAMVWWPPATDWKATIPADWSLPAADAGPLARQFPGVPAWWLLARLTLAFAAAWLLAKADVDGGATGDAGPRDARTLEATWPPVSSPALAAAAACAAASAAWAFAIDRFDSGIQCLFLVSLALPSLLLALGTSRGTAATPSCAEPRREAQARWSLALTLAVVVSWVAWRAWTSVGSPRAADVVDGWRTFEDLRRILDQGEPFLSVDIDPEVPGVNASLLFFLGLPLFAVGGVALSFPIVQGFILAWCAAAAAMAARCASLVSHSLAAAPFAAATLLWSPFVLLAPMSPMPVFLGPLVGSALALCLVAVTQRRGAAWVAALAGLAGLALTYPPLAAFGLLALLAALRSLRRGPSTLPAPALLGATLVLVAALASGAPSPSDLARMAERYAAGTGDWRRLELVVGGQVAPALSAAAWKNPPSHVAETFAASLLSIVAAPRTPLRLWGDVVYEPLSAGLALAGLFAALLRWRRDRRPSGLALPAILLVTLAPGALTSFERPSLTRTFGAPVVVALLAARGFAGLFQGRGGPTPAGTAAVLLAVAASGAWIFDGLQPWMQPPSAPGLALRALAPADLGRATFLTHEGHPRATQWLYDSLLATHASASPVPVVRIDELAKIEAARDILLWSPGLEEASHASARVCAAYPGAQLLRIEDRTGAAAVLGARLGRSPWSPREGAAARSDCALTPEADRR